MRTSWIIVIIALMLWISTPSVTLAEESVTSPEEGTKVYEVHIPKGEDKFNPSMLNIKVGETVTWINEDDRAHTIAGIPGQGTNDKELFTSSIPTGKSWSHTFKKAGEYPYFCYIHYVMMGVIIVEGEQGQSN